MESLEKNKAHGGWRGTFKSRTRSASEAIGLIKRGQRVFTGSSCGEPQALVRELARQAPKLTDIEIVRILRHGTGPLTLENDPDGRSCFNTRSFYLGAAKTKLLSENKRFITPINLSALPRLFKSRQMPIDVALIQVSPPDAQGWMSLGVSVDVTLAAAQSADMVIAQVNPRMPRVFGKSFIHASDIDVFVEHEEDLLTVGLAQEFQSAHLVAQHVAQLIEDGATLQISLGSTPRALLLGLSEKNDLGLHTQFVSDATMDLMLRGVITNKRKGLNEGKAVVSAALGSKQLYEFLDNNPQVEFYPSDYVNDPTIIARHYKMVTLNVAMAADLTGQIAADALPYNNFSGVSGIMDFVRGSALAEGGINVIMLSSTTMDGSTSRIAPVLTNMAVTVPRGDVQYIATEYGVVNLFGKNLQERAIAMISIANPRFRDALFDQAKEMGLISRERKMDDSIFSVYPLEIDETVEIDETPILFRPVRPTDERNIQEHFYKLDQKDVELRFMSNRKTFRREEMALFYEVDYVHSMCIVAVIKKPGFEEIIGVGGYSTIPTQGVAEVGYSVAKNWQHKGISGRLQEKLYGHAKKQGIKGFMAYVDPVNKPMVSLFHQLPHPVHRSHDGEMTTLTVHFGEAKTD